VKTIAKSITADNKSNLRYANLSVMYFSMLLMTAVFDNELCNYSQFIVFIYRFAAASFITFVVLS